MGANPLIELTAVVATTIAVCGVVPQLRRLIRTGDAAGVSLLAATVGAATETGWVLYSVQVGLWSAVPESALMVVTNIALAMTVVRTGTPIGRSLRAAIAWLVVIAIVTIAGGMVALGALLPLAYAGQVAPAIWCAYRTWSPSGVASATWVLIGLESALWAAYGVAHGDLAITMLAGVGLAAAALILLRKFTTRHRGAHAWEAVTHHDLLGGQPSLASISARHLTVLTEPALSGRACAKGR